MAKVKAFWYGTPGVSGTPAGAAPVAEPAPAQGGNAVCSHVACLRRPFCIVQKLGEVGKLYIPGRDQYRIKVGAGDCTACTASCRAFVTTNPRAASGLVESGGDCQCCVLSWVQALERAVQQVTQWGKPLDSERDVAEMHLGPKSAEKVRE